MPYHVLIVEDDKDVNRILNLFLKQAGFVVESVFDGESALKYLENNRPDAMVLDFNLPGVSGFEVIRRVRSDEHIQRLRIIGLTANSNAPSSDEAQMADLLLMKPFQNAQLIMMIKRLVGDTGKLSEDYFNQQ